jgi:hypothetical protein
MKKGNIEGNTPHDLACSCSHDHGPAPGAEFALSRRGLLGGAGYGALGALNAKAASAAGLAAASASAPLPKGVPLRVHPVLTYEIPRRQEQNSWRSYGDLHDMDKVNEEARRIANELKKLASQAEFPVEFLPVTLVNSGPQADTALGVDCDALLVYAAGGFQIYKLAASKMPKVVFIRHKSGPYYLWHEIAHYRLLRMNDDTFARDDVGLEDIVVDKYDEVLWRLRALYGLKNAKGTKMLAIGGLVAYSKPGQETGPGHAKEVWDYQFEILSEADFAKRLEKNRADQSVVQAVERRTKELLAHPNVKLATERKFVFNSVMALWTIKELMKETGASNFGFAYCMQRRVISLLDTPPCLVLSMANDEGYTAYCHTDLTHTLPGVLLHWISGKPTFVCNSHIPHDGLYTVAHCQAPRRMNGKEYEPATIMTHFESDYGAAVKVNYTKGQLVTVIIPNFHCTKWQGFRGKIVDTPSHPTCRSQMDIAIDGNWRKMLTNMQGFHTQVCYGDYLREVGYALKKLKKIEWENYSESA